MTQKEIALLAAKALDDKRAKDIVCLKVEEMTVITDYMVIATGLSAPQVKAMADNVEDRGPLVRAGLRRGDGAHLPRAGSRVLSARAPVVRRHQRGGAFLRVRKAA